METNQINQNIKNSEKKQTNLSQIALIISILSILATIFVNFTEQSPLLARVKASLLEYDNQIKQLNTKVQELTITVEDAKILELKKIRFNLYQLNSDTDKKYKNEISELIKNFDNLISKYENQLKPVSISMVKK